MKVRDVLALLRAEKVPYERRVRALQALLNANKTHHLTEAELRALQKSIKWGEVIPPHIERLPLGE